MNGFQLVIFDCDGVMFDSKQANVAFYNQIKSHVGLPPMTESEIEFVHMGTLVGSIKHVVPDENLQEKAFQHWRELDYSSFFDLMIMAPGLEDLLSFLKGRYKTAVATNRSDTIGPLLDRFQLTPYFDLVVSSLDVQNAKPDPEQLFLILNRLGIEREKAIFIGDSPNDAQAAARAKVPFIAYQSPNIQADYHIRHFDQVTGIIAGD